MDDIIILTENKKQYLRAKRKLKNILFQLKLSLSKRKTKMGKLETGFHFLGVSFSLPQSNEKTNIHSVISIHDRSCRRALDKINAMGNGVVDPTKARIYLSNWAKWWSRTLRRYYSYTDCIKHWTLLVTKGPSAALGLIGLDLLPDSH